jgi:hypothetical protein
MKPTPLHLVLSRIKRLSLPQQIYHLRALVALERPFSVRRNELQSVLDGKMLKQLRRENRRAA